MNVVEGLSGLGAQPEDPPEVRLRQGALIIASVMIACLSSVWVGVYAAYGYPVAAAIPATYQVVTVAGLIVLARTRRFEVFRGAQLSLMLVLPALLQLVLGGFVASSGIVLWSSVVPLAALALMGRRGAIPWLAAFLGVLVFLLFADPAVARESATLPGGIVVAFFALNISGVAVASFVMLGHFVQRFEEERERSERLLRNVLPAAIADELKAAPGVIAREHAEVSVLFADLAGFTEHAAAMSPSDLVSILDDVFSRFDVLSAAEGLEKIKTIGDAYMVASGIPGSRPDHAVAAARVAFAMLAQIEELRAAHPWLALRVGIDSGPVVAGVIGRSRFIYDLWGDTVNTASRMESSGLSGRVQVTARTASLLGPAFTCEPRGTVTIKGKGEMETFLLRETGTSGS